MPSVAVFVIEVIHLSVCHAGLRDSQTSSLASPSVDAMKHTAARELSPSPLPSCSPVVCHGRPLILRLWGPGDVRPITHWSAHCPRKASKYELASMSCAKQEKHIVPALSGGRCGCDRC